MARKSKKMPKKVQEKIRKTLKRGALEKYGYSTDKSAIARHRALNKCVKKEGYTTCIRRLNYMIVVRKNARPGTPQYRDRKIFEADANYLRKKYGKK